MQIWSKIKFIFSLLLWVSIWQLVCQFIIKDPVVFPDFVSILQNTVELFSNQRIVPHIIGSAERFCLAVLCAAPISVLFAVLVAGNQKIKDLFYPLISLTYPLPKVALLPFLLLVFGIGNTAKIAMIALGIFYLIFINVYVGLTRVLNGQLGDIVQAYEVKGISYWYHFLFKGSFAPFLTGFKTAMGYGLTLVVVSEISMAKDGIGFFIWSSWDSFRIVDLYSGLLILSIIGYVINAGCDYLISLRIGE